jgi:hypothetical protein
VLAASTAAAVAVGMPVDEVPGNEVLVDSVVVERMAVAYSESAVSRGRWMTRSRFGSVSRYSGWELRREDRSAARVESMCSPKFFADAPVGKEARFEDRHPASRAVPGSRVAAETSNGECMARQHSARTDAEEVEGPLSSGDDRTVRKKIV